MLESNKFPYKMIHDSRNLNKYFSHTDVSKLMVYTFGTEGIKAEVTAQLHWLCVAGMRKKTVSAV